MSELVAQLTTSSVPRAEYDAVRGGGAGLFDLSARGRIEVRGAEAVQFLNGLITNDVKALAPGAWMYAAFPNVQGRLLALARVLRPSAEAVFLFDTEVATRERVRQNLERFTLAGDFHVRDLTAETAQLSLQGTQAAQLIARVLGADAAQLERMHVAVVSWRGHELTLLRATHTSEDGFDLIAGVDASAELRRALLDAGAHPCGDEVLEVLRVEAGVARYGVDMTEINVVLEAVPEDAVSYTKGCYVGQEIIARIHWRGHVAKRLTGLLFEDDCAVAPEAKIVALDGKEIGRVTSVVYSPHLARTVALGYVKFDYLAPGTEVRVGEEAHAARISALPLVRGSWRAASDNE
ncbi:MAG: aminomethyltransferase family protein [Pyrinomonadaceae bacterium]